MVNSISGKLCHILILKIWLTGLALLMAVPCKAHKCQFCGEDIEWSRTVHRSNPSIAKLYCPKCASSIQESASQRDSRLAAGCTCRGACNCVVVDPESTRLAPSMIGLGLAGMTSLAAPHGMKLVTGGVFWLGLTFIFSGVRDLFKQPENSYFPARRQAMNAMLQVNNDMNQHPGEWDRINFLSEDPMPLFREIDVQLNLRRSFDRFLSIFHNVWLHIWSKNYPNTANVNLWLRLRRAMEDENIILRADLGSRVVARASLNSIFSGRREFPDLERELDSTVGSPPIHIELGYLRISLLPVGAGVFDMFETYTGVYRNLTKDDLTRRIGQLCEILNVYLIYIIRNEKKPGSVNFRAFEYGA